MPESEGDKTREDEVVA